MQTIWEHKLWDLRFGPNVWLEHQARQGAKDHLRSPRGCANDDDEDRGIGDDEAEEEQIEEDTVQEGYEEVDEKEDEEEEENEEDEEDEEEDVENSEDDDADDGVGIQSSSHVFTQDNGSRKTHDAVAELLELLFELCISFMTEEFWDSQSSSSILIYYSGILVLLGTGEMFRSAKLYTPILL
jgi:hypothetical protein